MIKLSFSNFIFTIKETVSKGEICATIKYFNGHKWMNVAFKRFTTKVTCKDGDKFDINIAYKQIKAQLEKDAYTWAGNQAQLQINDINKQYRYLKDFVDKSTRVALHNHKYICDLLDIKL